MICRNCGIRFAPFPKEDFDFVGMQYTKENPDAKGRVNGFYAKNDTAELRRMETWENNEEGNCGCGS